MPVSPEMTRERKIQWLVLFILTGFVASVIYHYVMGAYVGEGFPKNTFLFTPKARFSDFLAVYQAKSSVYFPFGNLVVALFCAIEPVKLAFGLFMLLGLVFVAVYFWINLRVKSRVDTFLNVLVFAGCSFPVLFLFDRANFELICFVFVALSVFFFARRSFMVSGILLSAAVGMKLFPIVFLVLFLSEKRYKEAATSVLASLVLTVASVAFLSHGDIVGYLRSYLETLHYYQSNYVVGNDGLDFGNSLFGALKVLFFEGANSHLEKLLLPYLVFASVAFVLLSLYVITIEKQLWKKVTLMVIALCLLPYVSADYKLVYLFAPLFLLINTKSDSENSRSIRGEGFASRIFIVLFGLLLLPKNYRPFVDVYDGVYLDPFLMSLLALLIVGCGVVGAVKRG